MPNIISFVMLVQSSRVSPVIQAHMDKELDEMIGLSVVQKSKSPCSSTSWKDGLYLFCVDFRKLNAVTDRNSYFLPYTKYIGQTS